MTALVAFSTIAWDWQSFLAAFSKIIGSALGVQYAMRCTMQIITILMAVQISEVSIFPQDRVVSPAVQVLASLPRYLAFGNPMDRVLDSAAWLWYISLSLSLSLSSRTLVFSVPIVELTTLSNWAVPSLTLLVSPPPPPRPLLTLSLSFPFETPLLLFRMLPASFANVRFGHP